MLQLSGLTDKHLVDWDELQRRSGITCTAPSSVWDLGAFLPMMGARSFRYQLTLPRSAAGWLALRAFLSRESQLYQLQEQQRAHVSSVPVPTTRARIRRFGVARGALQPSRPPRTSFGADELSVRVAQSAALLWHMPQASVQEACKARGVSLAGLPANRTSAGFFIPGDKGFSTYTLSLLRGSAAARGGASSSGGGGGGGGTSSGGGNTSGGSCGAALLAEALQLVEQQPEAVRAYPSAADSTEMSLRIGNPSPAMLGTLCCTLETLGIDLGTGKLPHLPYMLSI